MAFLTHTSMALLVSIILLQALFAPTEGASLSIQDRRSIRGARETSEDSIFPNDLRGAITRNGSHSRKRRLPGVANSEETKKSKNTSHETDVPTPSPIASDESTQAPFITGLVYDSNGRTSEDAKISEEVGGITGSKSEVCLGVTAQEPPSETRDGFSRKEFGMTVDVVYKQSTYNVSSTDIESYLNDKNIAMALWIAGCEDEANAIEKAEGKRRKLQNELDFDLIIYSQVEPWGAQGPCVKDDSTNASQEPLCQQAFSSNVQVLVKESVLAEDLVDQLTLAFGATSKPALQSQEAVVAVALRKISKDGDKDSTTSVKGEVFPGTVQGKRRVRNIALCAIGGLCILVSLFLFALVGLYEKRRKVVGFPGRSNSIFHVPLEDEFERHRKPETKSVDTAIDMIRVNSDNILGATSFDESKNEATSFDESKNENVARYEESSISESGSNAMASPCHNALDFPVPFDERSEYNAARYNVHERMRQEGIGRSQSGVTRSSSPLRNVRIRITSNNIVEAPDFEERNRSIDAHASRRNYSHEDNLVL